MTGPGPGLDVAPASRHASGRRPARPARFGRSVLLPAGIAAAGFTALAVWLANSTPPQVTHAEAMQMAAAIEQAKTGSELEPWFELANLDPMDRIVTRIATAKARDSYTFVVVRLDEQGRRSLLFRVHSHLLLLDYHELRLERRDRQVKVTDVWSCLSGGWLSELWRELESADRRARTLAFLELLDAKADPQEVDRAYSELPVEVRSSEFVASRYLWAAGERRRDAILSLTAAFQAEHPNHLGVALMRLWHPGVPLQERLAALDRIADRVPDPDYLGQLREKIAR